MLVSESNLERAVQKFLALARIPRPGTWHGEWDKQLDGNVIYLKIVPAFLEALKEIEDVQLCYGFDIHNVARPLDEGEK